MRYVKPTLCLIMATWLVLLGQFQIALGQTGGPYTIDWWTIDSGGGTSTGGQFAMADTVGQPDAANFPSTDNQRYVLTDGFWQESVTGCVELRQLTIVGPESGQVLDTYHFSLQAGPAQASIPLRYQWSPEPISGQGTANATYSWNTIAAQTISASATNCNSLGNATDSHTINILGRTIGGRVTDGRNPIGGITVQTGQGQTAVTDRNGYYKITGLLPGTYSFAPVRSGFTFAPASRTVTVPPDSRDQNFILQVDLALTDIEVTQGIQNLANDVPLVAEKSTYVRVYGSATPITTKINALLYGSRNGVDLPGSPLRAIRGDIVLNGQNSAANRARLESGWLFSLPYFWTDAGAIQLRVVVDPQQVYKDPNTSNNSLAATVNFQGQPPVCVVTIPVRTHTPLPSTDDPHFGEMIARFQRLWPISYVRIIEDPEPIEELETCWWGPFPHPCYGAYELDEGWGLLNGIPDRAKALASIYYRTKISDDPRFCQEYNASTHYMGIVHRDAPTGDSTGYAMPTTNQSWVKLPASDADISTWKSMNRGVVMAQELAHNHFRLHVDCGDPDWVSLDHGYPYPPCALDHPGTRNHYGFDIATLVPITPTEAADFMSYGHPRWVSGYTWRALLRAFNNVTVAESSSSMTELADVTVFASGVIDKLHSNGELSYLRVFPKNTLSAGMQSKFAAMNVVTAANSNAEYRLRLRDATGNLLSELPVTLVDGDDHDPNTDIAYFVLTFPAPSGQVAVVELVTNNMVIDTVISGANSPVVHILQPTAGTLFSNTMTIEWQANDPDVDDRLLFTVQYSYDNGVHWQTISSDRPATESPINRLNLTDLGSLPGSDGTNALVRVIASDGYNTTIATSPAFELHNRSPQPYIISPSNGQLFPPEQLIRLQGGADDPENGQLTNDNLLWQVDNLFVGVGPELQLAGLSPGIHQAVLTAHDSLDQQSAITSSFTIAPLSIPLDDAPALDGLCDDPAYGNGVALPLAPYPDFTQASVSLVRTADHLWVCFDELKKSGGIEPTRATIWIDANHSRDEAMQENDYGFHLKETGELIFLTGFSEAGIVLPETDESRGVVTLNETAWRGELQIHLASMIGANHEIGLRMTQSHGNAEGSEYAWPYTAKWGQPNTWATAVLGLSPRIDGLNPASAAVGSSTLVVSVTGANFMDGAQVLWNNAPLPTMFGSRTLLTATVPTSYLTTPQADEVIVQNPGGLNSNPTTFVVRNPVPQITGLTPAFVEAGGDGFTLIIHGNNFVNGATLFWDSVPLPTTFVNASQLTVEINASHIATGRNVGVMIINPEPDNQSANLVTFTVQTQGTQKLFLPLVNR